MPHDAAWRAWLEQHHATSSGVWLVVSKGGATNPTTLTFDQALEAALSHGWIEGQARGRDDTSYQLRFTPRRTRSTWSTRNAVIAERLLGEGQMHTAGIAEIERARSDGRWAAYENLATIAVPGDLAAALDGDLAATTTFAALSAPNRYAILYRIRDAQRPGTRARRFHQFIAMLRRGETTYARRQTLSG